MKRCGSHPPRGAVTRVILQASALIVEPRMEPFAQSREAAWPVSPSISLSATPREVLAEPRQVQGCPIDAGEAHSPTSSASVATINALIVCSRFSAWSKTMEAPDSNTSSVTSRAERPRLSKICRPTVGLGVVQRGKAVHEFHARVASRCHERPVDLVGEQLVDARVPLVGRFPHRQPNVGVEEVRPRGPLERRPR